MKCDNSKKHINQNNNIIEKDEHMDARNIYKLD